MSQLSTNTVRRKSKIKQVGIIILFTCIAGSLALAQSARSSKTSDESFKRFYLELRVAIQKRDRPTLLKLMPKDFEWNCCALGDNNGDGDNRDDAFEDWDNPKVHGWSALNRVVVQGAVPVSGRFLVNSNDKPKRVAPPQAVRKSYRNWFATFDLRGDRWYFTSFVIREGD